jgi:glycosyltransferase involved in cell wall biosynthesis
VRVLLVTHSFPRAEGDEEGAALWRLAQALVHRDHSVQVLAPADRGEVGGSLVGDVEVRRIRYAAPARENVAYGDPLFGASRNPAGLIASWRLVRALSRAVTESCAGGAVHVVHACGWAPSGLAAARAERRGRPLLVTVGPADAALARSIPGGRRLMSRVLRDATGVSAVATYVAVDAAQAIGTTRDRVSVSPLPLMLRRTADPDSARSGAVFIGDLSPAMGVDRLLSALGILRRQSLALPLIVVGDGPERAALKAQAIALGLQVVFAGEAAGSERDDYLRDRRVFVLPAPDPGQGLLAAEALLQGVPIVAARAGGLPDILVDPSAGILLPSVDAESLAHAIREVVKDERYKVGALRAGRILTDRYSAEKVAQQFEELYNGVRGSRRSVAARGPGRVSGS